jgi:hypothetical protein
MMPPQRAVIDRDATGSSTSRKAYLRLLAIAFTFFSSVRILTYVPTIWAIQVSQSSDQYSLFTWISWVGANGTMAAWAYESNGQKFDPVCIVNIGNALMCFATSIAIVYYRV